MNFFNGFVGYNRLKWMDGMGDTGSIGVGSYLDHG